MPVSRLQKSVDIIEDSNIDKANTRRDSQSNTSSVVNKMQNQLQLSSPVIGVPDLELERIYNEFLEEFQDIISKGPTDIGNTNLVQFKVETTHNVPVSIKRDMDDVNEEVETVPTDANSKKRANETTDSSSGKKTKKHVRLENSNVLKKLIRELSIGAPKVLEVKERESRMSQQEGDTSTFLSLYCKITTAEDKLEVSNQEVIRCYYYFGEALLRRLDYHKKTKEGREAQRLVNDEVRDQLPREVTKTTLRKRTERAREIYNLFRRIGSDKIQRKLLEAEKDQDDLPHILPPPRIVGAPIDSPIELYIGKVDIAGQGTVGLEFLAKEGFRIVLNSNTDQSFGKADVMVLDIGENETHFRKRNNNNKSDILASTKKPEALLDKKLERLYWFSLDKKNRRLRYGKGPMQSLLTVFSYDLPPMSSQGTDEYAWIENLRYIAVCGISKGDFTGKEPRVELKRWRLPVTVDLPPFISKREDATLAGLEMGEYTVIDNLPKECQVLYENVAGSNVTLNTPDFPDFSDAIEHSINTQGLVCYEKLREKASEFGKCDLNKTYLRVTLGEDQGNSPGVPFVLEIWPSGHYSPIHSHSKAFAVIKVLYNEILTRYYAGLHPEDQKCYNAVSFQQGQITWISDQFYQTHQLYNRTRKMCATIQCYQYEDRDNDHYEYFDYIDDGATPNTTKPFKPNTDWPFAEFKKLIREEWEKYKYLPDENSS